MSTEYDHLRRLLEIARSTIHLWEDVALAALAEADAMLRHLTDHPEKERPPCRD